MGWLKVATAPAPLARPATPVPASVLTGTAATSWPSASSSSTPGPAVRLSARMAWLAVSATYSMLRATATPSGVLKRALLPAPSTKPATVPPPAATPPASVATAPLAAE